MEWLFVQTHMNSVLATCTAMNYVMVITLYFNQNCLTYKSIYRSTWLGLTYDISAKGVECYCEAKTHSLLVKQQMKNILALILELVEEF